MDIIRSVQALEYHPNTILSVGTFDGIHRGHQRIISALVRDAARHHARSLLVTFDPHPQTILKNRADRIELLTPEEEKCELLSLLHLDGVLLLPFTLEMARMDPRSFIREILVQKIGLHTVVVGYDHAFGMNRSGNALLLGEMGRELAFSVRVIDPVVVEGETVSSTAIRHHLYARKIEAANRLLGREYTVYGVVTEGRKLGSKLGFPTANLKTAGEHKLLPGNGVYAVRVTVDGIRYPGMANLGVRPTVDGKSRTLEVHILDFERDIYSKKIKVEWVSLIRDEMAFDSTSSLISQMQKDRHSVEQLIT